MAQKALTGVLHHLHVVAAVQSYQHLSDQELLERFITGRDEAAFTVLIERHGPMVLRLCRRTLPNFHDAEDACQATFLVLARKAGSVRTKASLGCWLHGVACHVATTLKRNQIRRRIHGLGFETAAPKDPAAEVTWREMQSILDQELQHLPERYRAPLILCYLECMTRDEAAQHLGLSTTTFRGRLERARDLLRKQLTRRGVTLSAALSATAISDGLAKASLTPTFVILSTKAAVLLAEGQPLTKNVVAANVITLTQEILQSMFLIKLKCGTAIALCTSLLMVIFSGSFTSLSIAQDKETALVKKTSLQQDAESDADFIRRVSKELRDIEPTPAEVHFFTASRDPSRRQRLINLFKQERAKVATISAATVDVTTSVTTSIAAATTGTVSYYTPPVFSDDTFLATIKKIEGNKITINRSDEDNMFHDEVMTAVDKVVVYIGGQTASDGLKNAVFSQEIPAYISFDNKNNITAIYVGFATSNYRAVTLTAEAIGNSSPQDQQ